MAAVVGLGGEPDGGDPVGGTPVGFGGDPDGGDPVGGRPVGFGGDPDGGDPVGGRPVGFGGDPDGGAGRARARHTMVQARRIEVVVCMVMCCVKWSKRDTEVYMLGVLLVRRQQQSARARAQSIYLPRHERLQEGAWVGMYHHAHACELHVSAGSTAHGMWERGGPHELR